MICLFYYMDCKNGFQEFFYWLYIFGLGNVYMSIVDNFNQQMVWFFIVEGEDGLLGFIGGQLLWLMIFGYSLYMQILYSKNIFLFLFVLFELDEKQYLDFQIFD